MKQWCFVISLFLILAGCEESVTYQRAEGKIYGTYYQISYASPKDLQQEIRQEMDKVNQSLSMFNPQSVISKINRNETRTTDSLFRKMYTMAQKVYQQTEGGYDITVAPLVNAWGFGTEGREVPDSSRIDSLLLLVGMDKLELVENELLKEKPEMKLDASSIAKGLGVDLVAEYFDRQGISNYMIEIGGEVRVKGESDKKRSWRIGIDRPEEGNVSDRNLEMILSMSSGSLATSGNYRNFYMHEGKKYAHTINPKSGFPVQTEIVSASVYATSCMEADAYATGFMVVGLKKAQEIVNEHPVLEACLIYQEEGELKVWISDGLKKMVLQ